MAGERHVGRRAILGAATGSPPGPPPRGPQRCRPSRPRRGADRLVAADDRRRCTRVRAVDLLIACSRTTPTRDPGDLTAMVVPDSPADAFVTYAWASGPPVTTAARGPGGLHRDGHESAVEVCNEAPVTRSEFVVATAGCVASDQRRHHRGPSGGAVEGYRVRRSGGSSRRRPRARHVRPARRRHRARTRRRPDRRVGGRRLRRPVVGPQSPSICRRPTRHTAGGEHDVVLQFPTAMLGGDVVLTYTSESSPQSSGFPCHGCDVLDERRRGRRSLNSMCGIIAIVSRRPTRAAPEPAELTGGLDRALALVGDPAAVAAAAAEVDKAPSWAAGRARARRSARADRRARARLDQLDRYAPAGRGRARRRRGDRCRRTRARASAASIRLRDVLWAIRRDRLRTAREVEALAGRAAGVSARAGFLAIQQALSAIDRMEVRGRDSAGLHVFVWNHGLDVADPAIAAVIAERSRDPLFQAGSVRLVEGRTTSGACSRSCTRRRRRSVSSATTPRRCVRRSPATRCCGWRCRRARRGVGARAHPVGERRHHQRGQRPPAEQRRGRAVGGRAGGPYVVGVLNGDVDNHADLKAANGLRIAGPITTDAKVIPSLVARHCSPPAPTGCIVEAFRRTVAAFEGSVAIGAGSGRRGPTSSCSRSRGSGQGDLRRPRRGLLRRRQRAVRHRRGDRPLPPPRRRDTGGRAGRSSPSTPPAPGRSTASRASPTTARRLPVRDADFATAEVTTRDIDRGDAPHFLLKEISESPDEPRQDAARQDRRRRRPALRRGRRARALPPTSPRASPPADQARSRSSARAPPPSPAVPMADDARRAGRRRRSPSRRSRPPSCPASACGSTWRHAGRRRQPERHHHRHQPHGRPAQGARRGGARRSSTAARATSPTRPTA